MIGAEVHLRNFHLAQFLTSIQIFCTVSTQEKIDYLIQNYNIPRNRIFNSRDSSFVLDVMKQTKNRGVDVVLNSLSGELLHGSWKCVAEFGTMVEIGRRDFMGQGSLAMEMFEGNRTFAGFDLALFPTDRPEIIEEYVDLSGYRFFC